MGEINSSEKSLKQTLHDKCWVEKKRKTCFPVELKESVPLIQEGAETRLESLWAVEDLLLMKVSVCDTTHRFKLGGFHRFNANFNKINKYLNVLCVQVGQQNKSRTKELAFSAKNRVNTEC